MNGLKKYEVLERMIRFCELCNLVQNEYVGENDIGYILACMMCWEVWLILLNQFVRFM